jgi:hypothetical protein
MDVRLGKAALPGKRDEKAEQQRDARPAAPSPQSLPNVQGAIPVCRIAAGSL